MFHDELAIVRDETLRMLDKTQDAAERNQFQELETLRRGKKEMTGIQVADFWHAEAKVAAQFAYMRRLIRTEGFVNQVMNDFNSLDSNRSGRLDVRELEEYLRNRDRLDYRLNQLMSNTKHPPTNARTFLKDLDVDGDGQVSRSEWLMYVAYLHWQQSLLEYLDQTKLAPEKAGPCHCQ